MNEIRSIASAGESGLYSVEAEQNVLGLLLGNNDLMANIGQLAALHFYDPCHGRIFEAIAKRSQRGEVASPITINQDIGDDPGLASLGGHRYLVRLAGAGMGGTFIADYCKLIVDCWKSREVVSAMERAKAGLAQRLPHESPADHVSQLLTRVHEVASISEEAASSSFLMAMADGASMIHDAWKRGDGLSGVSTGIKAIDDATGGLAGHRLYVIGGRPGMGKTALALQIALNCARRGDGVFFTSLEMPKEEIATRFFSHQMSLEGRRVPYFNLSKAQMSESDGAALLDISRRFEALPFDIGGSLTKDPARLRQAVIRAQSRMNLKLIVIDYLQLLTPTGARNGYERVSEASLFCKTLAREFGLPVLALSQLSRSVEQRDDKRPVMSDLRESGQVEQDADFIAFTYRPSYYLTQDARRETDANKQYEMQQQAEMQKTRMEFLVEKNRGGPTGQSVLFCDLPVNTIRD